MSNALLEGLAIHYFKLFGNRRPVMVSFNVSPRCYNKASAQGCVTGNSMDGKRQCAWGVTRQQMFSRPNA
jgi:hypothetical protein